MRSLQRIAEMIMKPAAPLLPPTQFFVYHCQLCGCKYEVACRSQSVSRFDSCRQFNGRLAYAELQHTCGEIEGYNGFEVGTAKVIGYREYRN